MRGRCAPPQGEIVNSAGAVVTASEPRSGPYGGPVTASSIGGRAPAPVLFVVGGLSMYVGAALAVGLFDRLSPTAVALLRLAGAALLLIAWRRPGRAALAGPAAGPGGRVRGGHRGHEHGLLRGHRPAPAGHRGGHRVLRAGGRGRALLAPPARRRGGRAGRGSASCSSPMCAGQEARPGCCGRSPRRRCGRPTSCSASGWRAPATGSTRWPSASRWPPSCCPRCCCSAAPGELSALADPLVLLAAVGVGALSSVVPYVLDQIVLRRVGQGRFAVLLALLPVTAALVGLVAAGAGPGRAGGGRHRRGDRRRGAALAGRRHPRAGRLNVTTATLGVGRRGYSA